MLFKLKYVKLDFYNQSDNSLDVNGKFFNLLTVNIVPKIYEFQNILSVSLSEMWTNLHQKKILPPEKHAYYAF